jgi:uncharacterized RDD family membrane protein YckC
VDAWRGGPARGCPAWPPRASTPGPTAAGGDAGGACRRRGPGAVATTGSRVAAFVLDVVVGALLGALVRGGADGGDDSQRSLIPNAAFAVQVLVLTVLTGQSLGKRVLGIRVVRLADRERPPGLLPAAIHTALVMLVIPAVITDRDGRGLHDKAAGTLVVRTRAARPFAA